MKTENLVNIKAEKMCISATLNGRILEVLSWVKADDFSNLQNRLIFAAAQKLFQQGISVNENTVADRLKRDGKYGSGQDEVSFTYLENMVNLPPKDVDSNAEIVAERASRRKLVGLYLASAEQLQEGTIDAGEAVSQVVNKSFEYALNVGDESKSVIEVDDVLESHLKKLKEDKVLAFNLGYPSVDIALGGARFGDTIGYMGAPGNGKSLACTRSLLTLAKQGVGGVKYTLEMQDSQELLRMIAMESDNLPLSDLRGGPGSKQLTDDQWDELKLVRNRLRELPLWIEYKKHDLWSILADAKRRIKGDGVKAISIDYIQRIHTQNMTNETAVINLISSTCRQFSLENDVIVIPVIRMDKAGATAALKDEEITGAEGYGSSQLLSDVTSMLHFRIRKPFTICGCVYSVDPNHPTKLSTQYIFYIDEKTGRKTSKHKSLEGVFCPDCTEHLKKDNNKTGFADILKVRDGDAGGRVPLLLLGPRVKLVESLDGN